MYLTAGGGEQCMKLEIEFNRKVCLNLIARERCKRFLIANNYLVLI